MSLYNNPYNMVDAQELAIQEDNNYQTEQEMIYDYVSDYAEMYGVLDIEQIVESLETVTRDEVEEAVRKWRMIHDWA